ncbi:hypothetical protein AB0H18_19155 [Streptomyces sp. NPDC020766]|uniref:hypothetical protein n=1 Tax=Streptomyces sp. NPDC020766 TaxID=3155011 RepID=UPI0033EEC65B
MGSSTLVLDDTERWTLVELDAGRSLWGPVNFGASRLARLGDDGLYWNYVPIPDGQVLASLDPGSGEVRAAGRCERWGQVLRAGSGAVLALEGTQLVRRDARTAGVLWRKVLPLGPAGEPVVIDASGCLMAGPGLIVPVVNRGLVAVDDAGQPVWALPLGDAVFSVALVGDVLHMVSPRRYLQVSAPTGRVLGELDMDRSFGGELRQVHSAAVWGGMLFAADLSGLVFGLDLSSRSIGWTFRARARMPAGCPLAVCEGQLWAMDLTGDVYGFTL